MKIGVSGAAAPGGRVQGAAKMCGKMCISIKKKDLCPQQLSNY